MVCIEISAPGGPDVLKAAQRKTPTPSHGEVLIKVAAAGVNRPDVLQRSGLYPPPPGASDLPGLEVSGTIAAIGPGDGTRWHVGDTVCALLAGGGYAQYAIADARLCLPIPDSVTLKDAAGLPETVFTVFANVFEDGQLKAGETLLLHGGTSGIGTTAIAMAKAFGASIIATAGTPEKCQTLKSLGVDHAYQYNDDDWVSAISAKPIKGVDVVLDMAGGDFLEKNIACLRAGGRHVSIAFLRGPKGTLDIFSTMRKRLTITGSTLRARSTNEKARLASEVEISIWPKFSTGKMRTITHKTFALSDASDAHKMMEAGTHTGKLLLIP